jgi:hypothetical protein
MNTSVSLCGYLSDNGPFESDIITTKTHRRCHVWCAQTCWRSDNVWVTHFVHVKLVVQTNCLYCSKVLTSPERKKTDLSEAVWDGRWMAKIRTPYRHSLGLFKVLTPWSRVLLEKLTGFQPVNKFPVFYGTRRFITAFTSARHLSLSWATSIQSIRQPALYRHSTYQISRLFSVT